MKGSLLIILCVMAGLACQPTTKDTASSVTLRLPANPDRMIPLLSRTSYAREVSAHTHLPLLDFDPNTFELVPVLAEGRPIVALDNKGQQRYTFTIRPEATWDNGQPITAEDYLFTLKTIFHPMINTARFRAYLSFIDRVEVDAQNLKQFTVFTKQPYLLAEAALGNIAVLPAYHYDPKNILSEIPLDSLLNSETATKLTEENKLFADYANFFQSDSLSNQPHLISGAGPYQLNEWTANQQLVLQKKENWWGSSINSSSTLLQANANQLIYRILPDVTTATTLLRNQELDVLSNIEQGAFLDMQKDTFFQNNYSLYSPVMPTYAYIGLQRKNPILANRHVRRALAHLIDMEEIISNVLQGLGRPTVGPFHPDKSYYHNNLPLINLDIDSAKILLEKSGWTDTNQDGLLDKDIKGKQVTLELELLISSTYKQGQQVALLLQEAGKKVGLQIDIQPLEFGQLIERFRKRDFDMIMLSWQLPPMPDDPKQLWHTDSDTPSGSNRISFGDARSDAIIDSIGQTLDPGKRKNLYLRFQELVYNDQPYLFLYTPLHRIAIHSRFNAKTYNLSPGYFPATFIEK